MSELGVTDMEYVEEFGMPEELAGTPGINDWMIQHVYEGNLSAETKKMMDDGVDPDVATKKATTMADESRMTAKAGLKLVTKRRGY